MGRLSFHSTMSKRQKCDPPSVQPSELRRHLDSQGWWLYDGSDDWASDVADDEWFHWRASMDAWVWGSGPRNFGNIKAIEFLKSSVLFDVFNVHLVPMSISQKISDALQDHHNHDNAVWWSKKYGWKACIRLTWNLFIKTWPIPRTPSWMLHPTLGILRGCLNDAGSIQLTTMFPDQENTIHPWRQDEVVPLNRLRNLHIPFTHFYLYYFGIAANCTWKILEAIYLNWPDAFNRTDRQYGLQLKSLNPPPQMKFVRKDGLLRELSDGDELERIAELKRHYK